MIGADPMGAGVKGDILPGFDIYGCDRQARRTCIQPLAINKPLQRFGERAQIIEACGVIAAKRVPPGAKNLAGYEKPGLSPGQRRCRGPCTRHRIDNFRNMPQFSGAVTLPQLAQAAGPAGVRCRK